MTFVLDRSTQRTRRGDVVIGGSPLRLFRLAPAGTAQFDRLAAGDTVGASKLVERLVDAGAIHPVPDAGAGPRQTGTLTAADVTIVVPAWSNNPDLDPGAWNAWLGTVAGGPPVAGVVVVDDGSRPPLALPPGVRLVRRARNGGPAAARNDGLAEVTTALVAFVDTDVTVTDGWLDGLLGHFADDRVAAVAPRVASARGPGAVARYEAAHSPLDLGPEPARVAPGTRVGYVPGAALVARTDAVRAVGGFDPALRTGEDVDLVWRLIAAGHRVRYEPGVVVHHAPRPTWSGLVRQRIAYGSSAALLARRHPGTLAPVRMSGWTALAWALLLAGRLRLAALVVAATTAALVPKLGGVPAATSVRLALTGHAGAGRQLADAARRAWWPLVAVAALVSRRARRLAALAALPALTDGGLHRLLDDAAYGVGVWRGILTTGELGPLWPQLRDWPRRQR